MNPSSLFLGHGSPMTLVEPSATRSFFTGLGAALERPAAILCVSAHWEAARPMLSSSAAPSTIHDFGGFPEALYRMTYPAPGSPELAERTAGLLREAGFDAGLDARRGLDHGAWIPLKLAWPDADIPVVQLSLIAGVDAARHVALGRALRPLAEENVLVVGSGNLTHNLAEAMAWMQTGGRRDGTWAADFASWMTDAVLRGDEARLAAWAAEAPHARRAHPSVEHLLPLHVAYGAGGTATLLHDAMELGNLSMAAFAFARPN